ncbi:MAG: bacterial Ig-like domain-containing protein [Bacteroidaceae bacterium]|nr:bacterial Ig-like domain-containing protein [Bacteroidaceae bacterium]
MKQFTLKSLMLLLLLLIGGGSSAWGETKTGTIKFGTNDFKISKVDVTGNDDLSNSWRVVTVGTTSFTQQPNYSQVGSSDKPAKSITFTMTLPSDVKFTTFSAKFGGFKGTAGNISLTVDDTKVGSGSLSAKNDVVVDGELKTATTGKELKVSVTGIAKGVKCYNITYTYEDSSTPQPSEVALPTLSLEEGTYWKTQTLTIGVPEGAAGVQYTLDGTDPKESNTAELITKATNLELSATTTVRAIAVDNNDNYSKEVSRTYTFVPSIANTKETAYTTVEAIAIINKTSEAQLTDEVVYVKGIVSKIDSYNDTYKSITYWLDDNTFQVYSGKGLDGKDFTSQDDIEIGANVIICGKIKKFYNNYEFDKENYLVEYKAPVEKVLKSIAISGEATKTTYFEGETFDPTGLVVTATYDDESTRVVTNGVKWTCTPETLTLGATEVNVTATYGEKTASKTVAVTVTEAPKMVDIDLTKDQTTTATTDKLEWLGEIVTVTANKAEATTNANNYYPGNNKTSTRFYKNSTLTFTPAPFVVLGEITYEAASDAYASAMASITWTNATAEANGMIVTITPTDGSKPVSAVIGATTGGKSFSVNYSLANETSLTLAAKSDEGSYYATFSSASACEFADADVFTVNVEGGKIVLTEVANKRVPANTGVLLKSAQNIVKATRLESAPAIEGTNLLKPASEQMTEGFKYYKLAYDNFTEKTGLGFYWGAAEGGAFTVKPGLAYLAVPQAQAANVKGFSFDGTQTGINGVEATTAKGAIYNLNGQRVEKAQRGIYIQNGKKFIVK